MTGGIESPREDFPLMMAVSCELVMPNPPVIAEGARRDRGGRSPGAGVASALGAATMAYAAYELRDGVQATLTLQSQGT